MSKFNDLLSALFRRVAAKKIFFYTLTVFLIILPVSIALIVVSAPSSAKTSESTINVTLKDLQGNILASESTSSRDISGDSLASIIGNVNEGKSKIDSLPLLDEGVQPLIATIESKDESTALVCYFSVDGDTSYCTDLAGIAYSISKLDAIDFLTSEYAEVLYSSSVHPVLQTIDGETVLPISLDWNYKNVLNVFVKASEASFGETEDEYSITGQIDIGFSIEPDGCQARAYDASGNEIFDGSIYDLKDLIVNASDSVRVTVDAQWNENESSGYYGSASYDFNVIIANRSDFSVSSTTLDKDGFVILEATNIEDLSKIKFRSEQSTQAPEFVFVGNNVAKAILPYPNDIASDADTFSFSVSYRASMDSFTLDLNKDKRTVAYHASMPRPSFAASLANNLSSEIRQELKNINETSSSISYNAYNADFLELSFLGFAKNIDYGSRVFYLNEISATFQSTGCEFVSDSYGISVPALNAGLVVAVGTTEHLGNFVVVDHGMGLRVWYCDLSDVDVKKNSLVTKGQSVGKTDTSELSGKEGFWMYVTFKDRILDPNEIISY